MSSLELEIGDYNVIIINGSAQFKNGPNFTGRVDDIPILDSFK